MIARVAMALPIEAAVNGLPLWPMTVAPTFRQRSARRMSPVTTTVAHRLPPDPVVGGVEIVGYHDPLDQRMVGHAHPAVADDVDRHCATECDAIDLVLYRAGVGVDQDADQGRRRGHRRRLA